MTRAQPRATDPEPPPFCVDAIVAHAAGDSAHPAAPGSRGWGRGRARQTCRLPAACQLGGSCAVPPGKGSALTHLAGWGRSYPLLPRLESSRLARSAVGASLPGRLEARRHRDSPPPARSHRGSPPSARRHRDSPLARGHRDSPPRLDVIATRLWLCLDAQSLEHSRPRRRCSGPVGSPALLALSIALRICSGLDVIATRLTAPPRAGKAYNLFMRCHPASPWPKPCGSAIAHWSTPRGRTRRRRSAEKLRTLAPRACACSPSGANLQRPLRARAVAPRALPCPPSRGGGTSPLSQTLPTCRARKLTAGGSAGGARHTAACNRGAG